MLSSKASGQASSEGGDLRPMANNIRNTPQRQHGKGWPQNQDRLRWQKQYWGGF
jgi:hypothetical protein